MNIYQNDLKRLENMNYSVYLGTGFDYNSFTNLNTSIKNKFTTESNEHYYYLNIATPGLQQEDIIVKIKGDTVTIEIPESEFTEQETFERQVVFPFSKKNVSAYLNEGVFTLSIKKPSNYEYSVEVN